MESTNKIQTSPYQSSSSQEQIRTSNKTFFTVAKTVATVATVVLAIGIGIPYLHSEVYAYFFGEGIVSSAIFWVNSSLNLAAFAATGFFLSGSAGEGSSRIIATLNPGLIRMLDELKTTQKKD